MSTKPYFLAPCTTVVLGMTHSGMVGTLGITLFPGDLLVVQRATRAPKRRKSRTRTGRLAP